ncbi:MAG TPA: hypothetical protein VJY33_04255 [Isosphaeraceae bacterium]|nr:hypothetical protein [Isosphaeraceae bacterium]
MLLRAARWVYGVEGRNRLPRKWLSVFLTLLSLVATSSVAHAWNHVGHRVIVSIANR